MASIRKTVRDKYFLSNCIPKSGERSSLKYSKAQEKYGKTNIIVWIVEKITYCKIEEAIETNLIKISTITKYQSRMWRSAEYPWFNRRSI